jgi:hypothetical protein
MCVCMYVCMYAWLCICMYIYYYMYDCRHCSHITKNSNKKSIYMTISSSNIHFSWCEMTTWSHLSRAWLLNAVMLEMHVTICSHQIFDTILANMTRDNHTTTWQEAVTVQKTTTLNMTYSSNNQITLHSHIAEILTEGPNWGPKIHREQLVGNESGPICPKGALVILSALTDSFSLQRVIVKHIVFYHPQS